MKEIARNEGNNQLNIRKAEVLFLLAFFIYMSANTLDLTAIAFGQGNDRLSLINIFTKINIITIFIIIIKNIMSRDEKVFK